MLAKLIFQMKTQGQVDSLDNTLLGAQMWAQVQVSDPIAYVLSSVTHCLPTHTSV